MKDYDTLEGTHWDLGEQYASRDLDYFFKSDSLSDIELERSRRVTLPRIFFYSVPDYTNESPLEVHGKREIAAIKIQDAWRGRGSKMLEKSLQLIRARLQPQRSAATKIQSWFRLIARKQLVRFAAVKIQAWMRMKIASMNFRKLNEIVKKLQAIVRQRKKYRTLVFLVTKLQALCRMNNQKRKYDIFKMSVKKVQAIYRMNSQKRNYNIFKISVLKLQTWARMNIQQQKYRSYKISIVKLQALVRMQIQKRKYSSLKKAAIKLQAWARMNIQQGNYHHFKRCVTRLQAIFRMHVQRQKYCIFKMSVIKLQASARMKIQQRKYHSVKISVVKLETFFLMNIQRRKYCSFRCSVIKVQTLLRMNIQRNRYLKLKRLVTRMQATCRMKFQNQKRASTKISSWIRMCFQRRKFKIFKAKTITAQSFIRMKLQRLKYLDILLNKAAVRIQAWLKMIKCRQMYRNQIKHIAAARATSYYNTMMRLRDSKVRIIQTWWKKICVKKPRDSDKSSIENVFAGEYDANAKNILTADDIQSSTSRSFYGSSKPKGAMIPRRVLTKRNIRVVSCVQDENQNPSKPSNDLRPNETEKIAKSQPLPSKFIPIVAVNVLDALHLKTSLLNKQKRLLDIQHQKQMLTKSFILPRALDLSLLNDRELGLLTSKYTMSNKGFKKVWILTNTISMNTKAPPSPTTILENKMKNRDDKNRLFLTDVPDGLLAKKIRWNSELIDICPDLPEETLKRTQSTGAGIPARDMTNTVETGILKKSVANEWTEDSVGLQQVIVKKYVYK